MAVGAVGVLLVPVCFAFVVVVTRLIRVLEEVMVLLCLLGGKS